ncbi:MAG: CsgG/HfaB family protein [bacterium]|nr:CsgG/HfaB family protein [bacterium]
MRISSLLLASTLTLLSTIAAAARPTIAILPFSIDRNVVISDGRSVISGTIEDQTSLLTNELIHQLVATRKFDVLERARVDDLIKEKQFQESDYASPDEAPKIARLLGADYFVLGRIDDLEGESEQKSIPYSTQTYEQQKASIDLYLRVIDARTGKIVAAEKFDNEARIRINNNPNQKKQQNAGKQLIVQAAQEMVNRITNTVYPVKVAKVDGKTVYLNRGAGSSLKVGDTVSIYSQGDAVVDQDTREALGYTENEVAQARITAVDARFTKAELATDAAVKEGMLVKPAAPEKADVPADLPAGPRW